MFAIICYDGNHTELYTARDIAHHWVKERKKEKQKIVILVVKKGLKMFCILHSTLKLLPSLWAAKERMCPLQLIMK